MFWDAGANAEDVPEVFKKSSLGQSGEWNKEHPGLAKTRGNSGRCQQVLAPLKRTGGGQQPSSPDPAESPSASAAGLDPWSLSQQGFLRSAQEEESLPAAQSGSSRRTLQLGCPPRHSPSLAMLLRSACLLLVALGLLLATGEVSQEIEGGPQSKHDHQCFQSFSAETGALNLGQRWGDSSPTATLYIDLRTVTSAASLFDFRTFDPEGVIFYGDTSAGTDWFILGLRRGKPEMQIHNSVTNISVSGGWRLNDGHWHRFLVKNEGDSVLLEVDGEDVLTLRQVSHAIIDRPSSGLNIGVGGLLIPARELLTPMNPAMDGCMRRWSWLNKTAEWQESSALGADGIKACFTSIRRGSFFPGDGLASYQLSGLPAGLSPANQSQFLTVEMGVRAAQQVSTLLAVSTGKRSPVLHLNLQRTDLVAQLGNTTVLLAPLPQGGCLDAQLSLRITPSRLTLRVGGIETSGLTEESDFEMLQRLWLGNDGRLDIGGLLGQEESVPPQETGFFRGCLREIRVQGHELDLDTAHYRSNSIWAHSCPSDNDPGNKPSTNSGN